MQEGLQKQLQVVLRYHYHYMKGRAGGAAEESHCRSCACDRDRVYGATVCLSPHSPPFVRGGHLHAFDKRVLCQ